jgi:hypothetical protein
MVAYYLYEGMVMAPYLVYIAFGCSENTINEI